MTGILIGICLGLVVVFAIARALFGDACAVLLAGGVGYCFGGPPGAGAGIIVGLVLVPVTAFLGILLAPDREV